MNAAVLSAALLAHRRVLCPICMEKVFEMWPVGWDAHAAHKCAGLDDGTEQERKAAFKGALSHLFR